MMREGHDAAYLLVHGAYLVVDVEIILCIISISKDWEIAKNVLQRNSSPQNSLNPTKSID